MFGITNDYVAFCFDEAVGTFGIWIEQQLQEVEGKGAKGKRMVLLKSLLSESPGAGFADPANYV